MRAFFAWVAVAADSGVVYNPPAEVAVETASYARVKTDSDRLKFLAEIGWQTTGEVVEEESFTLPETFDRLLLGYN